MANANGDAYLYDGSSFIMIYNHSNYSAKAIDIANNGSIATGLGYTAIVDANGHVWQYIGDYSTIFTWQDITPVNNAGNKFARLDINPSSNDIVLTDASGYVSKVNSTGGGLVYYARGASNPTKADIAVDDYGTIYSMSKDGVGMDAVYRYSGSSWSEEPQTGLHYFITCGAGGQAWVIKGLTASQSSSFANQSTIYTRVGDGSATWIDDERVQTSQNDNAIMIPVAPGTYTINEANVSNWNLQNISIYDSTSGSTMDVAGNSVTVVVSAGQVAHVVFTNGLVAPTTIPSTCGTSISIQNFGSGANNTRGNPLTGLTDFHYYSDPTMNTTPDGYYSLSQNSSQWGNSSLTDHSGLVGGYFMIVNASYAPNMFYRHRLTGLVPGNTYTLSFWAANLSPSSPLQPNILAGITDTSSGITLGSVSTGSLPIDNSWHQYVFSFVATVTTGDIFLRNNALGGFGNDLAIDDISLSMLCNVLPISLINFNAQKQGSNALLKWSTTSLVTYNYFEIERSADGSNWSDIGRIDADTLNASVLNYSYPDNSPLTGTNYYRIKGFDANGEVLYSVTEIVQFNSSTQWMVSLYPNPATSSTSIKLQTNQPIQMIRVFDINGKLMMLKNIAESETSSVYPLNINSYPTGMYILQVANNTGGINNIKFIRKD
jgi:hypothetical protein